MELSLIEVFKKKLALINPSLPLGGLEISDTALRYVLIQGSNISTFSVRIAPGVLDDGQIKIKEDFKVALQALRHEIGEKVEPISVIAAIVTSRVYSQVFTLPILPKNKIKESLDLNLQMISPVDIKLAYYDSQFLGDNMSGGQDYLGTFVDKSLIDILIDELSTNGFMVAAIEFPALSIARVIKDLGVGYDFTKPYFVFNIYSDGMDFMILKEGNLFFHYFASWLTIVSFSGDREISFPAFEDFLKREGGRVLNFYSNKWGGAVKDAIAINRKLPVEVRSIFEKNFNLKIQDLSLSSFNNLQSQWLPALGSAIRGLISRSKDELISLAPVGTEDAFIKNKFFYFLHLWRNVLITTVAFLCGLFLISDLVLWSMAKSASASLVTQGTSSDLDVASELRMQALNFNKKIDFILLAKQDSFDWFKILIDLKKIIGSNINLVRITGRSEPDRSITIYGKAKSEAMVIEFKNLVISYLVENYPNFKDVNLPLTEIVPSSTGEVSFRLSFSLGKQ